MGQVWFGYPFSTTRLMDRGESGGISLEFAAAIFYGGENIIGMSSYSACDYVMTHLPVLEGRLLRRQNHHGNRPVRCPVTELTGRDPSLGTNTTNHLPPCVKRGPIYCLDNPRHRLVSHDCPLPSGCTIALTPPDRNYSVADQAVDPFQADV